MHSSTLPDSFSRGVFDSGQFEHDPHVQLQATKALYSLGMSQRCIRLVVNKTVHALSAKIGGFEKVPVNNSRLTSMIYPNGRVISYNWSSAKAYSAPVLSMNSARGSIKSSSALQYIPSFPGFQELK